MVLAAIIILRLNPLSNRIGSVGVREVHYPLPKAAPGAHCERYVRAYLGAILIAILFRDVRPVVHASLSCFCLSFILDSNLFD
jgi:hypothetical protein